jgi:signal transduction histidine kinase
MRASLHWKRRMPPSQPGSRSSQAAAAAGEATRDEADARDRAQTSAAAVDHQALGASEQANAALWRANAALTESRAARHAGEQRLRLILESATARAASGGWRLAAGGWRLAESIPHFVFRCRSSGGRLWGSPQWTAFTSLSEKQSLGMGWLDAIHPDDRRATVAAWAAAAANGLFSVEHRTRHAADGTFRWFQSRAVPVRGKIGRIAEWFGTSADIHDQILAREVLARGSSELEALVAERTLDLAHALDALRTEVAERSRTEEILRQTQKMEAVGQLTGGIAHDFNNMLQGIAGGLHMARQRLLPGRNDEILRYLNMARDAVERAGGPTRRLLAFARQQTLDPEPVNPGALVPGMVDLVRRTVGPEIAVGRGLCDSARDVICDPNELENALLNLCINARDAIPQGGAAGHRHGKGRAGCGGSGRAGGSHAGRIRGDPRHRQWRGHST